MTNTHGTGDGEAMTNTPGQAAIMVAHPIRTGAAQYRCCVFHANGSTEVSPRLSYAAARCYATDRGAKIGFDEHPDRLAVDEPYATSKNADHASNHASS